MLIDSHCHLDYENFAADLDGVMERAAAAGVGAMLTIGTRMSNFDKVLAVAERYDNVYCTVGVHPHEAGNEAEIDARRLIDMARHPKVVGFGETGLDYFYDNSPRLRQRENFRTHLQAAREAGLPVVVHTRDADDDTALTLAAEASQGPISGLIHCFSSGRELAEKALELGFYISLSGIITFSKSDDLRHIVRDLPLERLLVETDAPYLAPVPKRGKTNEPAFVVHTAAKLAELKYVTMEELAKITTANFYDLFTKVPR